MGKDLDKAIEKAGSDRLPDVLEALPIISEPRCNICRSDFRPLIDRMIAGPYTIAAIARQFMGKDEFLRGDPNNRRDFDRVRKSIERHAKMHVKATDAAVREIIEQRALEANLLVDESKNTLLTTEALLDLYLKRGFEQITKEGAWVRHQDVLEAVKMIEEMRRDTVAEQVEVLKKQVAVISQAVREIVPPELHPRLVERAEELFKQPVLNVRSQAQREEPRELEVLTQ